MCQCVCDSSTSIIVIITVNCLLFWPPDYFQIVERHPVGLFSLCFSSNFCDLRRTTRREMWYVGEGRESSGSKSWNDTRMSNERRKRLRQGVRWDETRCYVWDSLEVLFRFHTYFGKFYKIFREGFTRISSLRAGPRVCHKSRLRLGVPLDQVYVGNGLGSQVLVRVKESN